ERALLLVARDGEGRRVDRLQDRRRQVLPEALEVEGEALEEREVALAVAEARVGRRGGPRHVEEGAPHLRAEGRRLLDLAERAHEVLARAEAIERGLRAGLEVADPAEVGGEGLEVARRPRARPGLARPDARRERLESEDVRPALRVGERVRRGVELLALLRALGARDEPIDAPRGDERARAEEPHLADAEPIDAARSGERALRGRGRGLPAPGAERFAGLLLVVAGREARLRLARRGGLGPRRRISPLQDRDDDERRREERGQRHEDGEDAPRPRLADDRDRAPLEESLEVAAE